MRVRSPWVWVAWLMAIAVSFAVLEGLALADPQGLSLSQFYVNVSYGWPLIGAVITGGYLLWIYERALQRGAKAGSTSWGQ